jgi:hypothetical protein
MNPKVGLIEETTGKEKERKIVTNNEVHYICAGSSHKEAC